MEEAMRSTFLTGKLGPAGTPTGEAVGTPAPARPAGIPAGPPPADGRSRVCAQSAEGNAQRSRTGVSDGGLNQVLAGLPDAETFARKGSDTASRTPGAIGPAPETTGGEALRAHGASGSPASTGTPVRPQPPYDPARVEAAKKLAAMRVAMMREMDG
jgi:hypothetical protein